jgi:Transposase DDE domain group 1
VSIALLVLIFWSMVLGIIKWFASMAYVLLCALRRIGLHDTDFAKATCGTIRLKLLKIGAIVRFSVRRIKIAMASACPAAQD